MSNEPGVSLVAALADRYQIEREIGQGGMATVYLARDVRHGRRVAVKVLNPVFGASIGAERFLAEIRVTASLNHPNLLALFDSGEADGYLFYVMPFVDGETLRARIDRERLLPVDEAVRYTTAVASALEYAHSLGVVHRDLKPGNILFQAGQPILADFGIARAVTTAGGHRLTQSGISVGTPQYMSPEQASGSGTVDARSDQYSLAVTLYEMLVGEPPHSGATAQVLVARILTEAPRSVRAVRPSVPAHVDAAIDRALSKLPADRFATMRDFVGALQRGDVARPAKHVPARSRRMKLGIVAVGAVALTAAVLTVARPWQRATNRTLLDFDGDAKFQSRGTVAVALSADGSQVVYTAGLDAPQLYLKRLADSVPTGLPGSEGGSSPQFSPDEKWIAFMVGNRLMRIPMSGGMAVTIADSIVRYAWGDQDVIVVSRPDGALARANPSGGPMETIVAPDASRGELRYTWPHVLPGGHAVLFNIAVGLKPDSFVVAAVRLADRLVIRLPMHCVNPRYAKAGYLLCTRTDGTIIARPFNAERLEIADPVVAVLENVEVRGQGAAVFAVSRNGTLVYVPKGETQLVMVNRSGQSRAFAGTHRQAFGPRVSPDGKHLAFYSNRGPNMTDVWTWDFNTDQPNRITTDGQSFDPDWTPDGHRLVWTHRDSVLAIKSTLADGSESVATLVGSVFGPFGFDGSNSFLTMSNPTTSSGLAVFDLGTRRTTKIGRLAGGEDERRGFFVLSPDGRWLAYQAVVAERAEVFVEPIPTSGARHQVTVNGGSQPVWAPSGKELFYYSHESIWAASIITTPGLLVTRRDSLFAIALPYSINHADYDVMPDGNAFVAVQVAPGYKTPVLVTGWFSELRARMERAARK